MERRRFVLTSLAAALAGPLAAVAQQAGKSARIGRLSPVSAEGDAPFMSAFRQGLQVLSARTRGELDGAFATLTRERAEALMVLTDVMFITERRAIVELAACHRVPAIYFDREFVDTGGLMFYGASLVDMYRRSATYVDRVLKGARPADLPIEQPTKFGLVINLKTAKALGLTIPPSLLARADQVME